MKEKTKLFKGLSESAYWLPFVVTLLEAHNMLMLSTNGNDEKYCHGMMAIRELLLPLHGKCVDRDIYNRAFLIFIYVQEFVYGNPYKDNDGTMVNKEISVYEFFENMKKHWDDDVTKELEKIDNKINKRK